MGLLAVNASDAQPQPSAEYKIKAVFLFNFAHFIDWPQNAFSEKNAPFIIGILGSDPFGGYLKEAVAGENIAGHPFVVQRYNDISEIKGCHILFINQTDPEKIRSCLSSLNHQNILTVSDNDDFAKAGGMIRFFKQSNKIKLQINTEAARNAQLNISSKLLRVSEIFNSSNH